MGSFALYAFPESHATSFALFAYASCWLKVHRPAEFYMGLINNHPMGSSSVHSLRQDAMRRGLKIRPVSCVHSAPGATVTGDRELRLGLLQVRGLRKETADAIAQERTRRDFRSLADFLSRVQPNAKERRLLAKAGALNDFSEVGHRRDAMWQVELPLYGDLLPQDGTPSTLEIMTPAERLSSDFTTMGASTGPHPMKLWRERHPEPRLPRASELRLLPHGFPIQIAGMVICRQRPGTAKGHCFISLEDETGIANLFVNVKIFRRYKLTIVSESFLLAEGRVQISEGDQPAVYVTGVRPLEGAFAEQAGSSHDFH